MQDEDWIRLGASIAGVNFDTYVSVNQELAMCGELGSGSSMKERQGGGGSGDDDEAKPKPVLSFTEALNAFETMRAFMYAHFTERPSRHC